MTKNGTLKKLIAVTVCLALLFGGCIPAENEAEKHNKPLPLEEGQTVLRLGIPADSDELLLEGILEFEARLKKMTEDKIVIERVEYDNWYGLMTSNDADIAILKDRDVIDSFNDLSYLSYPFIFKTPQEYMIHVAHGNKKINENKRAKNTLGFTCLGNYYGGSSLIAGSKRFIPEMGFFSSIGVFEYQAHSDIFLALGAEEVKEAEKDVLFDLFANKEIRFMEISAGEKLPDEVIDNIKSVIDTHHRYSSYYFVKDKDSSMDKVQEAYVMEAFAYSVEQQDRRRIEEDEKYIEKLMKKTENAELYKKEDIDDLESNVRGYYRKEKDEMERSVWEELWELLQKDY